MQRKRSRYATTSVRTSAFALLGAAAAGIALAGCGGGGAMERDPDVVTVYTGRHYGIEDVFDQFTEETGIKVRFTSGSDPELRERLVAEGDNSPADIYMTADAANIDLAATAGVLRAIDSPVLEAAIPEDLRSADDYWFGLSERARVVMYSTERVTDPPVTYAEVGDPMWNGRLCMRPSTLPYMQSLTAALIDQFGEDDTRAMVESWVANDPLYIDSDVDIIKAIDKGDCDVAIANTYYLGQIQAENPDIAVAISWPDQDTRGAHVNVSAAGITANAPNPTGAQQLIEWLATDGNGTFANSNYEYPANPEVTESPIVAAWGDFVANTGAVRRLGELNSTAVDLLSDAGYK